MVFVALRLLTALSLLTGVVYPVLMFAVGQAVFPDRVNGNLLRRSGHVVGASLIGQKFDELRYLHGRPSASGYATLPAGASNLGPTSSKLAAFVRDQKARWGEGAPPDLLYASASGLDPHISPRAAWIQLDRIASARHLAPEGTRRLYAAVDDLTEGPELGFLGPKRINVLHFNLKLDELFP